MKPLFLEMLDELRAKCGFPFTITSGYRDPKHTLEAKKEKPGDRKSTRLNSSHTVISYAVFCLKKKKKKNKKNKKKKKQNNNTTA